MNLRAGDTIDQYEIVGTIGAGGMGQVYKVRHRISQRMEALKLIQSTLSDSADLHRRFMQEIRILATLNHPHIASLHNAFEVDNQLFMVMEYVEGVTLGELMKRGRIALPAAVRYVAQTLSALEYAHSRKVIHRDVKPSNIMISSDRAKLMDFGIAVSRAATDETTSGVALGSVYYMSPEQVKGGVVDGRSDLYSVGVILYELLTGVRPFEGKTNYEVLNAQVKHQPSPPIAIDASTPAALSQLCLKALAKGPGERFGSAREFRTALEAAAPHRGVSSGSDDLEQTMEVAAPESEGAWLSTAELQNVERRLTPIIGPIARFSVKRAYKETKNAGEFCDALALLVPDGDERKKVAALCRQELGLTPAQRGSTTGTARSKFEEAVLEGAARSLARFIGPVARVVVARTAKRVDTLDQLYIELANEIPTEKDRAQFLHSVQP